MTFDNALPVPAYKRRTKIHETLSAEELHSKLSFPPGAKCSGCQKAGKLRTRCIVLAPLDEVRKRDPMFDVILELRPTDSLKLIINSKYGPLVRLSTAYACKACTPALERSMAKSPSWAIVDWNMGPKQGRIVSGRYGTSSDID